MEGRIKKPRSLNRVLGWYLVRTALYCIAVVAAALAGMMLLFAADLVLPANTQSLRAQEEADKAAQTGVFDISNAPEDCRWLVLESAAAGSPVRAAHMADRYRQAALEDWAAKGENVGLSSRMVQGAFIGGGHPWRYTAGYTQYYRAVLLEDGAVLLFQYDFAVPYADPALNGLLPDFQLTGIVVTLALLLIAVLLSTRRTARFLSAEAAKLTAASEKIAAQQLPPPDHAAVREFDAALAAMQTLGRTMTDSLQKQWAMEQQRTDQVAALAHDLKTPLTIMQGNAELLAEEPLSAGQQAQVEAILRGAARAQSCLAALRAAGAPPAPRETVDAAAFVEAAAATGRALCRPAGVRFALQGGLEGSLHIQTAGLTRALENLLDNAVRYTPPGGLVTLTCARQGGEVAFTVSDTGPGFTPEARRKAGRFLYTEDAARPADGHQGLGLYLARAVAQAHGGTLTLGDPPAGASVTLTVADRPEDHS